MQKNAVEQGIILSRHSKNWKILDLSFRTIRIARSAKKGDIPLHFFFGFWDFEVKLSLPVRQVLLKNLKKPTKYLDVVQKWVHKGSALHNPLDFGGWAISFLCTLYILILRKSVVDIILSRRPHFFLLGVSYYHANELSNAYISTSHLSFDSVLLALDTVSQI